MRCSGRVARRHDSPRDLVVGAVREPPLHVEGKRAALFERSEFAARPEHAFSLT
jgi:hypothetical protein